MGGGQPRAAVEAVADVAHGGRVVLLLCVCVLHTKVLGYVEFLLSIQLNFLLGHANKLGCKKMLFACLPVQLGEAEIPH